MMQYGQIKRFKNNQKPSTPEVNIGEIYAKGTDLEPTYWYLDNLGVEHEIGVSETTSIWSISQAQQSILFLDEIYVRKFTASQKTRLNAGRFFVAGGTPSEGSLVIYDKNGLLIRNVSDSLMIDSYKTISFDELVLEKGDIIFIGLACLVTSPNNFTTQSNGVPASFDADVYFKSSISTVPLDMTGFIQNKNIAPCVNLFLS